MFSPPLMGTSFFPSRKRCCPDCQKRTIRINDKKTSQKIKVTEYFHRVVVCHLIGYDLAIPVDAELLRPGEDETKAARRMLERILSKYGTLFDVVVGDAFYFKSTFFNYCIKQGKDVIAVLKNNNKGLLDDAKGLFASIPAKSWNEDKLAVHYWDEDGFEGPARKPLRILHTLETKSHRERIARHWVEKTDVAEWFWATSVSKKQLPTRSLWMAAHGRWDIENDLFNLLVNHWHLNHCFKHDATAIINFTLTLFIVFILTQCFYHRNLKPPLRARITLTALPDHLYAELIITCIVAPWIEMLRGPPI